ncbi:MAG: hypothetical protein JWP89_1935 [Schlesneria sp.]|nr:hypothetical protein [Schlesneria sp.]
MRVGAETIEYAVQNGQFAVQYHGLVTQPPLRAGDTTSAPGW